MTISHQEIINIFNTFIPWICFCRYLHFRTQILNLTATVSQNIDHFDSNTNSKITDPKYKNDDFRFITFLTHFSDQLLIIELDQRV